MWAVLERMWRHGDASVADTFKGFLWHVLKLKEEVCVQFDALPFARRVLSLLYECTFVKSSPLGWSNIINIR